MFEHIGTEWPQHSNGHWFIYLLIFTYSKFHSMKWFQTWNFCVILYGCNFSDVLHLISYLVKISFNVMILTECYRCGNLSSSFFFKCMHATAKCDTLISNFQIVYRFRYQTKNRIWKLNNYINKLKFVVANILIVVRFQPIS